jgi:hypothetical protein
MDLSLAVPGGLYAYGVSPFGMDETGHRRASNVTTYYRKPGSLLSEKPLQLCAWLLYNQTENPEGRKALRVWHIRVLRLRRQRSERYDGWDNPFSTVHVAICTRESKPNLLRMRVM